MKDFTCHNTNTGISTMLLEGLVTNFDIHLHALPLAVNKKFHLSPGDFDQNDILQLEGLAEFAGKAHILSLCFALTG